MLTIKKISPYHPQAQIFIEALDVYHSQLYPAESNHLDSLEVLAEENVYFVGAFKGETLIGCGAVKLMPDGYGEIKRVYVDPPARRQGVAHQIMDKLEQFLQDSHILLARLETGIYQKAAITLYERRGYQKVGPFGSYQEDPLSLFMEKDLSS